MTEDRKVSHSYECDTFLIGMRHSGGGMRHLFSMENAILVIYAQNDLNFSLKRIDMENHLTIRVRLLVTMLAAILPLSVAKAETGDEGRSDSKGWYVGVSGGLPFGFSTFSSFGFDKLHLGWTAGLYGGYQFNPIFSAELSAKYGEMNLTAQDCCVDRNYWLGSDGVLYRTSVLGMTGWDYADLKSRVRMGQYGARVNVNILGLFHKTAGSRWNLSASPHVYAVTTKASVRSMVDGTDAMKGSANWHFGYGADLQIGYRLSSCLSLGIYSGVTRLTGKRMDGMPEYLHKNNFVWESGVRLGISLSKKAKKSSAKTVEVTTVPSEGSKLNQTASVENVNQENASKETVAPVEHVNQESAVPMDSTAPEKNVDNEGTETKTVTFPVIYFAFNSIDVSQSEEAKLNDILRVLNENPDMKVSVTGWCDSKGSETVNKRISRLRAESVKNRLVRKGIEPSRISVFGNGIDWTRDAEYARRVEITDNK